MNIDRQRISAVAKLQALGFEFRNGGWEAVEQRAASAGLVAAADLLHGFLLDRAEQLAGCSEGSEDETELAAIGEAIEEYESARWPLGRAVGGKG